MIISINIHQTPLSYCSVEGGVWAVASEALVRRGRGRAVTCEQIIAESELLQDHAKTAVSEIQLMNIVVYA